MCVRIHFAHAERNCGEPTKYKYMHGFAHKMKEIAVYQKHQLPRLHISMHILLHFKCTWFASPSTTSFSRAPANMTLLVTISREPFFIVSKQLTKTLSFVLHFFPFFIFSLLRENISKIKGSRMVSSKHNVRTLRAANKKYSQTPSLSLSLFLFCKSSAAYCISHGIVIRKLFANSQPLDKYILCVPLHCCRKNLMPSLTSGKTFFSIFRSRHESSVFIQSICLLIQSCTIILMHNNIPFGFDSTCS